MLARSTSGADAVYPRVLVEVTAQRVKDDVRQKRKIGSKKASLNCCLDHALQRQTPGTQLLAKEVYTGNCRPENLEHRASKARKTALPRGLAHGARLRGSVPGARPNFGENHPQTLVELFLPWGGSLRASNSFRPARISREVSPQRQGQSRRHCLCNWRTRGPSLRVPVPTRVGAHLPHPAQSTPSASPNKGRNWGGPARWLNLLSWSKDWPTAIA